MRRRLIRVVPLYWIFTTAMLVAMLVFSGHITHNEIVWQNVVASYFFIPWNNAYDRAYPVLILGWTLNFEMFFYALMAVSLSFSKKLGVWFLYGAIALFGVLGWADFPLPQPLAFWANPIVFEFLFGVLLAQGRASGLRLPLLGALIMGGSAVALMLYVKGAGIAGHHWWARPFWMGVPAALICAAAVLSPEGDRPGVLKRLLSKGGDLSYALYLSHPFALTLVAMAWGTLHGSHPWVYVWVATGASLFAAVLIHRWVERPLTDAIRLRLGG
jgi:peptidoglycan/LPS O-acetylase OafA/YrhL